MQTRQCITSTESTSSYWMSAIHWRQHLDEISHRCSTRNLETELLVSIAAIFLYQRSRFAKGDKNI
jgi:hypothetical protein